VNAEVLAEIRRLTAPEDGAKRAARERGEQLGLAVPPPEVCALFAWVARTVAARTAVEIGSCGGVTGVWLLEGMAARPVLTSIEHDPHAHGMAQQTFDEAQTGSRVRAILGEPLTVLPRLSDGGYDLVLLQGRVAEYPDLLAHARRLLRPGGVLLVRRVTRPGDAPDALARCVQSLVEDEGWSSVVLPLDDGLALATRVPDEPADER
jgi:predicted O-methyltransferase YrrM